MNATHTMEADTTSGKTNLCKNFINNELRLKICILIYVKNGKYKNNKSTVIISDNIHMRSNV